MPKQNAKGKPAAGDDAASLAEETLTGDVRDWLLGRLRTMKKPWPQLSEREQQAEIDGATLGARDLVRKTVNLVVGHEFETVNVTVGKLGVKDGNITAEFKCQATDRNILNVANAGRSILVLADTEDFEGEREPARPMKDQPDLMADAEPEMA